MYCWIRICEDCLRRSKYAGQEIVLKVDACERFTIASLDDSTFPLYWLRAWAGHRRKGLSSRVFTRLASNSSTRARNVSQKLHDYWPLMITSQNSSVSYATIESNLEITVVSEEIAEADKDYNIR